MDGNIEQFCRIADGLNEIVRKSLSLIRRNNAHAIEFIIGGQAGMLKEDDFRYSMGLHLSAVATSAEKGRVEVTFSPYDTSEQVGSWIMRVTV